MNRKKDNQPLGARQARALNEIPLSGSRFKFGKKLDPWFELVAELVADPNVLLGGQASLMLEALMQDLSFEVAGRQVNRIKQDLAGDQQSASVSSAVRNATRGFHRIALSFDPYDPTPYLGPAMDHSLKQSGISQTSDTGSSFSGAYVMALVDILARGSELKWAVSLLKRAPLKGDDAYFITFANHLTTCLLAGDHSPGVADTTDLHLPYRIESPLINEPDRQWCQSRFDLIESGLPEAQAKGHLAKLRKQLFPLSQKSNETYASLNELMTDESQDLASRRRAYVATLAETVTELVGEVGGQREAILLCSRLAADLLDSPDISLQRPLAKIISLLEPVGKEEPAVAETVSLIAASHRLGTSRHRQTLVGVLRRHTETNFGRG